MEEEDTTTSLKKRVRLLVAGLILLTVILLSVAFVSFQIYSQYDQTESELEQIRAQLADLQSRVLSTAKYVTTGNISLAFVPYQPMQHVSGTMITYLLGFVTVTNLTRIVARPLTLIVSFMPTITYTMHNVTVGNTTYQTHGNVTYQYTPSQTLEIPPSLDQVLIPWGAFPLTLQNFTRGDVINWNMTVTAQVLWVGTLVTQAQLETNFKLIVT